jgi:hypothetical protein
VAVRTILNLPSAARATYSSGQIALPNFNDMVLNLDVNVTAFTGGTSPTVKFTVSRVGADGVLYALYTPGAISTPGVFSQSIGHSGQTNADLGDLIQVDMVTTGSPTSITFSLSAKVRGF